MLEEGVVGSNEDHRNLFENLVNGLSGYYLKSSEPNGEDLNDNDDNDNASLPSSPNASLQSTPNVENINSRPNTHVPKTMKPLDKDDELPEDCCSSLDDDRTLPSTKSRASLGGPNTRAKNYTSSSSESTPRKACSKTKHDSSTRAAKVSDGSVSPSSSFYTKNYVQNIKIEDQLERNRQSARRSRVRKQVWYETLQNRFFDLEMMIEKGQEELEGLNSELFLLKSMDVICRQCLASRGKKE